MDVSEAERLKGDEEENTILRSFSPSRCRRIRY